MGKTKTRVTDCALSSDNSIKWAQLEQNLLKHKKSLQFGLYRNDRLFMGDILKRESQFLNALDTYLEVCYLDLNGPRNCASRNPQLLKEYPPFDPTKHIRLAPGVIRYVDGLLDRLHLSHDDAHGRFVRIAVKIQRSLKLSVDPDDAWHKIATKLNEKIVHYDNSNLRVPFTWRTSFAWDRVKLNHSMLKSLKSAAATGVLADTPETTATITALADSELCDSQNRLTNEGRVVAISQCDLSTQCEILGLPLQIWHLPKDGEPELAALAAVRKRGCKAAYCEGGAIKLLLYCLCFERLFKLAKVYWGSSERAESYMYGSIMCYGYLLKTHPELPVQMVADITECSERGLLESFDILKGWQRPSLSRGSDNNWSLRDWIGVDRDFVLSLYRALTASRCAAIAKLFLTDPYAYVKGWPDLIWVDGTKVGLIEVKTTDKLHPSQIITIPEMRQAAAVPVEVVQIQWN